MIDFDQIGGWSPQLKLGLSAVATDLSSIRRANPQYVEAARDLLFKLAGRDEVIDATMKWLRSSTIKLDCGMVFRSAVPPAWITNIETIAH